MNGKVAPVPKVVDLRRASESLDRIIGPDFGNFEDFWQVLPFVSTGTGSGVAEIGCADGSNSLIGGLDSIGCRGAGRRL